MDNYPVYINGFWGFSTAIDNEIKRVQKYWELDEVPTTTLLGAIGRTFSEDIYNLETSTIQLFFEHVESGISSGDDVIETAVATGLVEVLVAIYFKDRSKWDYIEQFFGKKSLEYAVAWRDFQF